MFFKQHKVFLVKPFYFGSEKLAKEISKIQSKLSAMTNTISTNKYHI